MAEARDAGGLEIAKDEVGLEFQRENIGEVKCCAEEPKLETPKP